MRLAVSVVFSLLAASGVSNQWEEWLLFVNRKDFGVVDPLFNTDIGFYVFRLPFLTFLVNWLFAAFMIILVVIGIAHYINGGIRGQVPRGAPRVLPSVKVHLSAILAGLALVKAADYWLSRYELTVSDRGVVDGALYTDVKAKLPALNLLLLISLFAVVLLVVNLRRRGWVLPVLAVGLWAFTALVMGNMYPAFVQRFQVDPNTTARESVYTDRQHRGHPDRLLAGARLRRGPRGVRLPGEPFGRATESRGTDRSQHPDPRPAHAHRHLREGPGRAGLLPLLLGARRRPLRGGRRADPGRAGRPRAQPERAGIVGAPARGHHPRLRGRHRPGQRHRRAGQPGVHRRRPARGGRPGHTDIQLDEPQIYVGENLQGYALVGATRDEVDYVDGQGREESFRYDGQGGVNMGSFLRQTAFALRFGQLDPLISNFVDGDTSIIYIRDARTG